MSSVIHAEGMCTHYDSFSFSEMVPHSPSMRKKSHPADFPVSSHLPGLRRDVDINRFSMELIQFSLWLNFNQEVIDSLTLKYLVQADRGGWGKF